MVTVIIPTRATLDREPFLRRALTSLVAQDVPVQPLVVTNGGCVDHGLAGSLRAQVLDAGATSNHIAARAAGVAQVLTPFYAFLDDDDELLPNTVGRRVREIGNADVLVSNGEMYGRMLLDDTQFEAVAEDPLSAALSRTWLASSGGLFRTGRIAPTTWATLPPVLEWTVLAVHIALDGQAIAFDSSPAFRVHNTPASASKQRNYDHLAAQVLLTLAGDARLTRDQRRRLRARAGRTWHRVSATAYGDRVFGEAWAAHIRSLSLPGGWRYLSYTRHLVRGRAK